MRAVVNVAVVGVVAKGWCKCINDTRDLVSLFLEVRFSIRCRCDVMRHIDCDVVCWKAELHEHKLKSSALPL